MRFVPNRRSVALGVTIAALGLLVVPDGMAPAAKKPKKVEVVNSPSVAVVTNPLPVNGQVQVSNFPTSSNVVSQPTLPATPFSVGDQGTGVLTAALGSGTVALTDLVMSQENTAHERLNVIIQLFADAGDGTCATLGDKLKDILPYSYIPAADVTSLRFATPIVAQATTVCLRISMGSNAGLFFSYVASGFVV